MKKLRSSSRLLASLFVALILILLLPLGRAAVRGDTAPELVTFLLF